MDDEKQVVTLFDCVVGSPGICGPVHPRCLNVVERHWRSALVEFNLREL